jgi:hypothetical protein
MSAQFLVAWKDGVRLAGPDFFGRTNPPEPGHEETKWDYCPREKLVESTFGGMSGGEKRFLAGMISFYNADWGQKLLKRAGSPNICDLSAGLDGERRTVIARLFLTYEGW